MSKLIKQSHHPSTKTIAVKSIDQLTRKKPKESQTNILEEMNLKKSTLEEQAVTLENKVQKLIIQQQTIREKIKKEIAEQRAAWEEEKHSYIEQANKQGYEVGYKAGEAAGLAQYTDLLNQANDIVQLATDDYNKTIRQCEPAIIKLAVHVAEKIIHQQLNVDTSIINRIVQDAITDLSDQEEIKIYVSPKDYDYLLNQKKDLENVIDQSSKLFILIDDELDNGMCFIEYPSGKTDASIATQLDLIEAELLNIVMEQDK